MNLLNPDGPPEQPPVYEHDYAEGTGHCFGNSFRAQQTNPDWLLVHGWMIPPSGDYAGERHQHAWLERDWEGKRWVYDSADSYKRELVRADEYYGLKAIDKVIATYTPEEAARHHADAGGEDPGPWHPDLRPN